MDANKVLLLRYRRHGADWAEAVLSSPPAKEAKRAGVDVQPKWGKGAKIIVAGMTEAVFLKQGIELRPFHVVIAAAQLPQLEESLKQLVYRQRPPLVSSTVLGDQEQLETWTYTIERSFVHVQDAAPSMSAKTATTNDRRPEHRNPRRFRPDVSSSVKDGSHLSGDSSRKSLEDHGGRMKAFQGQCDLAGVLQTLGDIVRDGLQPDTYCYTIVIDTCAKLGKLEDAESYWARMTSEGVIPNVITFNSMMNACARAGEPRKAEKLFHDLIAAKLRATTVTYNVLIKAYAQKGELANADRLLTACQNAKVKTNAETFAPFIDAYGQLGDFNNAKVWLDKKCASGLQLSKTDYAMMVNAHANAADLEGALKWLDRMKQAGHGIEVTDFTQVLKACGRAKDKASACTIFRTQIAEGIKPDHFNLVTFFNVAGDDGRRLCQELGVSIGEAAKDFEVVGEAFNFEPSVLKRKPWRVSGYNTPAMDLDGLIRNDFGGVNAADEPGA